MEARDEGEASAGVAGAGAKRRTGGAGAAVKPKVRSLTAARLRYCQKLLSYKVAEALPHLVEPLTAEARKGSVPHAQALLKLASLEQGKLEVERPKRSGKSLALRMLAEMRKPPAVEMDE